MTDDQKQLLRHFLAALAYRTQKALRDAPEEFGEFNPDSDVRPPKELVRHMTGVLGYARTFFIGGQYRAEPLPSLNDEIARFHQMLESLSMHVGESESQLGNTAAAQLLQGPFADAMTHAGQLAILRRLAGAPVPPENFIVANINSERLGIDQPQPVSPDKDWPEAPANWPRQT